MSDKTNEQGGAGAATQDGNVDEFVKMQQELIGGGSEDVGADDKGPAKQSFEIVHNGRKMKVDLSPDQLVEYIQKAYDYTSKTQQLSEERKKLDELKTMYETKLEAIESEYGLGMINEQGGKNDDPPDPVLNEVERLKKEIESIKAESSKRSMLAMIEGVQRKYSLSDDQVGAIAEFGDSRGITDFEVAYFAYRGAHPEKFEKGGSAPVLSPIGANDKSGAKDDPLLTFKKMLLLKSREGNRL